MGIKKNFLVDAGLEANLASSFANTVAVTGAVTFSNTMAVTGNVTFSNTLSVANIITAVTFGGLITGASGLTITGTANATVGFNVGANVSITTARMSIGNSTVNTAINSSSINVTGTANVGNTFGVVGAATFSNNVTISGDLTVSGTTTYVNTATLNVADNIIALNTDVAGAPSENAGIEVNRGTSANVQFVWDETNDRWSTSGQPLAVAALSTSGVYTASANINLSNNHLINSRLTRYTESVTANTTGVGSSYAIDLSTANIFDLTLSANVTFSVTNPPSSGIAQGATIILRQDATGGRTVTFPSSFKTTDGIAANSAISTGANRIDVFTIITVDGGTVYLASQAMANVG
jgi:fibronectin-binding autotransporter adhesin